MIPSETGLSNEKVKRLQEKHGPNILPEKPPPGNFSLFISQFKNPLIYVLVMAGAVTTVIGHFSDAAIILFAVGVNTILGFIQERKAQDALYALKHYVSETTLVIRNGKRVTIETSELVPGDIVILAQGVKVPADGILIQANRLSVNEAILTGESAAVEKKSRDEIYMGTTIASGQAVMRIEKIGKETKMGLIALQIQEIVVITPLQKQLNAFSKQLLIIIGILIVLVFIVGIAYRFSILEIFTTAVALAVSSIPEGLIVSLTVVLAIGMQKILKRKGLVKKLAAAETLGGVTVICVDKTGTLTEGKMTITEVIGDKRELAEQVLLANDLDDPIVITAYEWGKTIVSNSAAKHQRLDSIPFSSENRRFISLHQWTEDTNRLYVNGAPEVLLEYTNLSKKEKTEIRLQIDRLTRKGKRLIGFARKDVSVSKQTLENSDGKDGLVWVGILAFSDPVRQGVKEALVHASLAGIRSIVITGDYAKTSQFILSELGITLRPDQVITGDEVNNLSVNELSEKVKTIQLFARTTPDQKLKIVQALKMNGEIVAMMGDGVNDAPALHMADIGIAVGDASDVAKESSDLILIDSNFSTIVAAIEEGRVMFENIRKIILYLMCGAFGEIIVVLGGIILGLPLPLTAVQILWINLVSDGLPNLALTTDPKRRGVMHEKPRQTKEKLVSRWMIILISIVSVTSGLSALTAYVVIYNLSGDIDLSRSITFMTLGLSSLMYVFSIRTLTTPFWKSHILENRWLLLAVALGLILQIVPFVSSPLRQFFGLSIPNFSYWLVAGAISIGVFFVIEGFKFAYHSFNKSKV